MPWMELDYEQMKQVVLNLIINAIEAMEEEGIITLHSKFLKEKGRVLFSVTNNGPGIPPENQKKLFTPFFTTKQIGHGTGLGLAICYGIIKMHSGDIKLETEPGKFSRFEITVPRFHSRSGGQLLGKIDEHGKPEIGFQPRRFSHFDNNNNVMEEENGKKNSDS